MIKIDIAEPNTPEWQAWRQKADQVRANAEKEFLDWLEEAADLETTEDFKAWRKRKPKVKENLYKAMRDWYLELFNYKCAYCETRLQVGQGGDVEHYRPKGSVQGDDGKSLTLRGKEVPHPGYYWLAYEWSNLMPACGYCNRPSQAVGAPAKFGKHARFPLADESRRAERPGDENNEEPSLLNPYEDRPEEHLVFDETGAVAPRHDPVTDVPSAKAERSIAVYGLFRPGLAIERKKAYLSAWKLKQELLAELMKAELRNQALIDKLSGEVREIDSGAAEYSAVARLAVQRFNERAKRAMGI